jgi:hypothetical protein
MDRNIGVLSFLKQFADAVVGSNHAFSVSDSSELHFVLVSLASKLFQSVTKEGQRSSKVMHNANISRIPITDACVKT